MTKTKLKDVLDKKIKEQVFQDLKAKKESHSKVKNIKFEKLEMQKYLKSCKTKITQEEAQEIFKMRSRVSNVKMNFKGKYESLECEACEIEATYIEM